MNTTTTQGADALMLDAAILEGELAMETEQAKLLRDARAKLDLTNEQLATVLGVKLGTLLQWMLPEDANAYRPMNATARLLLDVRLEQGKKKVQRILAALERKHR